MPKITIRDQIKLHRKHSRKTTHQVKPIVYKDKKKESSKKYCRKPVKDDL